jgi:hypothetical protein
MNRRMRTRMYGGVGAGGEIPPATRFGHILSNLKHMAVAYNFSEVFPTGKIEAP